MLKKIKNKLLEEKIYIFFAVIFGLLLIKYKPVTDDILFKSVLKEQGILGFIKSQYFTWNSRLSTTIITAIIGYNLYFWKIVNIVVCFLFLKSFSLYYGENISQKDKWETDKVLFVCVFMFMPQTITTTFIWMSGTLPYLWPLTAFIYAIHPFYKFIFFKNIEISKKQWVGYYFAMFIASYVEQEFLIILFLGLLSIVVIFKNKKIIKQKRWEVFCFYVFFLINFIIARVSPALRMRTLNSMYWYPNWENMTFIYRFYEVINFANKYIIDGFNMLFFIFVLFLSILIYKKYKYNVKVLYLPLFYFILKIVPIDSIMLNINGWNFNVNQNRGISSSFYNDLLNFFLFDVMKVIQNIKLSRREYIPSIITFSIIIFISFILYEVFEDKKEKVLYFLVYWAGIFSVYILMFIPSIYAIGSRIFLMTNICIVFLIMRIYLKLKKEYQIDKNRYFKISYVVFLIVTFLMILPYFNNLGVVLWG